MSLKLKALGFAVLAAMSVAALVAVSASATVSGHFVSEAPDAHTIVNQKSALPSKHGFVIRIDEGTPIACEEFSAFGTATGFTLTEVEGTTEAKNCRTEGTETAMGLDTNGCKGKAWSNGSGALTGAMVCPSGSMVVTHPNCSITVPPQTNVTGLTPTTITTFEKHAITLDVNIKYTVHYEGGICIFLGTKHTASITGSTIIWGQSTNGQPVSITST